MLSTAYISQKKILEKRKIIIYCKWGDETKVRLISAGPGTQGSVFNGEESFSTHYKSTCMKVLGAKTYVVNAFAKSNANLLFQILSENTYKKVITPRIQWIS